MQPRRSLRVSLRRTRSVTEPVPSGCAPEVVPGRIFRHERFYLDRDTGLLRPKYFLVLAIESSGDCIVRLLTSRAHARPEEPPCFHGTPYPGYFLGIPGQGLEVRTWLDLRFLADFDGLDFRHVMARGVISMVLDLAMTTFVDVLDCVARADDTTRNQERAIRAELDRRRRRE